MNGNGELLKLLKISVNSCSYTWHIKISNEHTDLVSEFINYEKHKYHKYKHIFTDGSKDPITGHTGAAVVIPSQRCKIYKQTSNYWSVYTVELYAILIALEWVEQNKVDKALICSDSKFLPCVALSQVWPETIKSCSMKSWLLTWELSRTAQMMWIPAHKGIMGNERVDRLGLTGRGLKDILECGRKNQGRKYLFCFLKKTDDEDLMF